MIKILSKRRFDNFIKQNFIDDNNVEGLKDYAFISILNSPNNTWFGDDDYFFTSVFKLQHENVLILTFDDVENQSPGNIPFSEEMADMVLDFVNKNKERDFIIHCAAGISRSGAIGSFINNYVQWDFQRFKIENPQIQPNARVLRMLNNKAWEMKYGKRN